MTARVPLLSDADAWAALPDSEGPKGPLPAWARALAGVLPRTTAATLEADSVQRARSPLDPKLPAAPPRRPPATDAAGRAEDASPILDFEAVRAALEAQKARAPRIPVPSPEEVRRRLPPGAPERFLRINWSRVCVGYQPELALAW